MRVFGYFCLLSSMSVSVCEEHNVSSTRLRAENHHCESLNEGLHTLVAADVKSPQARRLVASQNSVKHGHLSHFRSFVVMAKLQRGIAWRWVCLTYT